MGQKSGGLTDNLQVWTTTNGFHSRISSCSYLPISPLAGNSHLILNWSQIYNTESKYLHSNTILDFTAHD